MARLTVLIAFCFCIQYALALNILAIVSLPLHSHYMAMQTLFRELAVKGHSVTVFNNFPDKNAPPNMQFVDLGAAKNFAGYITPLDEYEKFDSTYLHLYNYYRHFVFAPMSTKEDCENFFSNENVKAHNAKGVKYDLIFVEMFMGECGLAYAGATSDAPIIGITSHVLLPTAYPRLGIPFDYGADAFYFSKGGPNPTLYNKVEAFFMDKIYDTFNKYLIHPIIYDIFNKHLPNNGLDIEELARERMKMFFSYQHFSLTGARLLAPQVLEIGGIHIAQPKPVPEQIEKFLSSAKHGVIYVSFGSNLKANTMSLEKRQEFLNAFKRIPQKVIWKYENNSLPAGNDNVYTHTWLPQLDILCHPKVLGFVSHGGMLSLSEAAHCGKPVVAVPFFGDQFGNAASAQHAGLGKMMQFDQLTADSLAGAIRELTSPGMQQSAKKISKLWHDRPMSVMDSAIYWTEYVARHRDAPPSLPSKHSTWYERLLLDVAAVLIALGLAIILILVIIFKLFKFVIAKSLGRLFCHKNVKKPKRE